MEQLDSTVSCVSFSSCAGHLDGFACVAAKIFFTSVVITPDVVRNRECVSSGGAHESLGQFEPKGVPGVSRSGVKSLFSEGDVF